jgi:hypothetical protein
VHQPNAKEALATTRLIVEVASLAAGSMESNGPPGTCRQVTGPILRYCIPWNTREGGRKMDDQVVIKETLNLLEEGFDPAEIVALMRLRLRIQKEEDEETAIIYKRLKFACWLVEHGRLSE